MTAPAQTSGLLNSQVQQSSSDPSDSGMPQLPPNPTLDKIEQGIEAKIPKQLRQAYLSIVVAGNHVLFSPKTLPMFVQKVKSAGFMQTVPDKIANLMALISNQAGKNAQGQSNMNMTVMVPAALTLTCHAIGFFEQTTGTQLTPDIIAQVLHDTAFAALQKFGVGPQQIAQAQAQAKQQGGQQSTPPASAPAPQSAAPQPGA